MFSKLIKVLSFIIALVLVLIQVDLSFALGNYRGSANNSFINSSLPHRMNNLPGNPSLSSPAAAFATLGDSWEEIITTNAPLTRYTHGMAYDSSRQVMVLFGGDPDGKGTSWLDDTWEYDASDWTQITPDQSPPGRVNIDQAMVYDHLLGKTVLFGGRSQLGHMDDTWEYDWTGDTSTWEPITPTVKPLARDSHAMVFDTSRALTIMFGGYNPGVNYLNDTWEYNGNNWTEVSTSTTPPGRHHHAIAYDSGRGVVVLYGGQGEGNPHLNDTWEYNPSTHQWIQIPTTQTPTARQGHSMVYDAIHGLTMLFGGFDENNNPLNETWVYDGANWSIVLTSLSPQDRGETPLVYDSHRERMVLFSGGYFSGNLVADDDTWEYVGGTGAVPPLVGAARADIGMPYNTDRGCASPYTGCGGPYHGFYAGVNTDIVLDAYNYNTETPFDIQSDLQQDSLNFPGRYRFGTARYAEDMYRYFTENQQVYPHAQPYDPGDIAFFDWDGDGLADHVSMVSQLDADRRPVGVVDATGFFADNHSGKAIEHNWTSDFEARVTGHGRLSTITPTLPLDPTFTGQALRVRLEGGSVLLHLWDENGRSVSDVYNENFAATNVEDFIPFTPGSYYTDLGSTKIITVTNPLNDFDNIDQYSIEINNQTGSGVTYTLYIETIQDSEVTDSRTFTEIVATSNLHLVTLTLSDPAGNIKIKSISPLTPSPIIETSAPLEMSGAPGTTPQIVTSISETGGTEPINDIQISASDLTDQLGGAISNSKVSISYPNSDIDPGDTMEVTVAVDLSSVPLGMYQGNLLVTSSNGYPVRIPLTVWVIEENHSLYLPLITK